jgi:hypothetical protein
MWLASSFGCAFSIPTVNIQAASSAEKIRQGSDESDDLRRTDISPLLKNELRPLPVVDLCLDAYCLSDRWKWTVEDWRTGGGSRPRAELPFGHGTREVVGDFERIRGSIVNYQIREVRSGM